MNNAFQEQLLVVGASGFLGVSLCHEALSQGYGVTGTGCQHLADGGSLVPFDLGRHPLDLHFLDTLPEGQGRIALFFAAISAIDYCGQHLDESRRVNVTNTIGLMQALSERGYRIVFISTDNVFAGTRTGYREDDPVAPINTYGEQKVAVETFMQKEMTDFLIVRLSKVCAAYHHPKNLFDDWAGWLKREGRLYCIKDQFFSPTATTDVARVLLQLIQMRAKGIYHLAGASIGRTELARLFLEKMNGYFSGTIIEQELATFNFFEPRTLNSSLDNSKVVAATGFEFTPMDLVIDRYVDQFNHGLC